MLVNILMVKNASGVQTRLYLDTSALVKPLAEYLVAVGNEVQATVGAPEPFEDDELLRGWGLYADFREYMNATRH